MKKAPLIPGQAGLYSGPLCLESGRDTEWLETNGAGAFAGSTIIECHTRKYHGLLVTPLPGREGRYHILSAVEASANHDPDFILGTNQYPGIIFPRGFEHIESFSVLPFPCWIYKKGSIRIKKEVFMIDGEPSVYIVFTLLSGADELQLDLKFLFTFRNSHSTTKENQDLIRETDIIERGFTIKPYSTLPGASVEFSGRWERTGAFYWDKNIEYSVEILRGLDHSEDRFVPGNISILIRKQKPFITRTAVETASLKGENLEKLYSARLKTGRAETGKVTTDLGFLKYNAGHFLVKNSLGQKSVNAGFPWFGEWGRDTMIALPGLTFNNENRAWGADVLCDYASMIKDGLLPNTLGESQGYTSYNSIDAGLLYCRAVLKMYESGYGRIKSERVIINSVILPAVGRILEAFISGSVPRANLTRNGLIEAGTPDTQLTWMDATSRGKPVTPRHGLAVELNALWYDSLYVYKELLRETGKKIPGKIIELLDSFSDNFIQTFWLEEGGYLSDTVVDGVQDCKLRPNMLFASSAAEGLLDRGKCSRIVSAAKRELLTPMGLRTLAPDDPDFAPAYEGNSDERDSKYHQGTVWPWLIGIMVESSLKAATDLEKESEFWANYLYNLLEKHLYRQGTGFISEIFDGLNPTNGKGCFAQAWSTGEIIRAFSLLS